MRKILFIIPFFIWTCGGGSESPTESEQTIPLAANFTADPISGVHPLQVQFTSTSTGTINSYAWDVDSDSNIDSYSESFVHTYGPGTFSVSLTVSGPNGSNTTTKEDFINVSVGSNDSSFILSDIYSLVQNNMVRRIEWENYVDDPTSEQEGGGNSEIGIS